ncbi:magnesium and cobalt transport protein CorA [Haladaptatus sp. W1]|uniref:magnesium/cobalt transporter CorA n=1 Tax=Haladaptatus sp. W1 TaxID=1897478 RepID=UPI000849AA92|nr:magnesium/cobalt transporter CorA [Haladaptatus sp. W1]ODR82338.1 magnesium and cobalt transport protein CorA [Haladaptatus sp. W1]
MTVESLRFADGEVETVEDFQSARVGSGTVWVRASDATPLELERVAEAFDIHHLSIEDIRNEIRPKTEEFAGYTFVLLKTVELARGETTFEEETRVKPVGVFVGEDWLVTLSEYDIDAVSRIWRAALDGDRRIVGRGPDFTAYRVCDGIVDGYFAALDQIEEQIEAVEEAVISDTSIETLESINGVRRELLAFRKLAWPTREAVGYLARGDPEEVRPETEKYFRDVYDHLVQLVDLTETYRDLAGGARDIYLNMLSVSTNEVMKKLTVVATIVLPLTLVVGVYGMNFQDGPFNMPELGWTYGYPAVMLGMFLMSAILVVYFRKAGWL